MMQNNIPDGKHPSRSRSRPGERAIVRSILAWYRRGGRSLPWRNIDDPYRILVSEIMLQQTRVQRVLLKYPEFLRQFPTLESLAGAPRRKVVMAWQGMGYNNRAVRLHLLAQRVVEHHGGSVPDTFESLIILPGIGRYTANAVLSSAFRRPEPVVDINVRRLLSRVFWPMHSVREMRAEKIIWELAAQLLPPGNAYQWNQAIMDLGATLCTARRPSCEECPVADQCKSRRRMTGRATPQARIEPSFMRIPHRIYRGKIIQQLRERGGELHLTTPELGKLICPRFSRRNERWLAGLLDALQRDGLVRVAGNGSFHTRRVFLA